MEQTDNYWMAVATILPVLGLAMLLVARVQARQLVDSRGGLFALGVALVPVLFGLPIVEVVSLIALLGVSIPEWLFLVSLAVFGTLTAMLFLVPAVWLGRAAFAPLEVPALFVLWQIRIILWQRGRLIRRSGRLRKEYVAQLLEKVSHTSELLEQRVVEDPSIGGKAAKLRAGLVSEIRVIELISQEFAIDQRHGRESLNRAHGFRRDLAREYRKASALSGWGVFSGSVGHESFEQVKEEIKRREELLSESVKKEIEHGRTARSGVWTNLQYKALRERSKGETNGGGL
ncbi:hypothetical protein ACFCZ3_14735 [Cellulosimicrobium cellulans]|uniref:hypothetical protein n=1 Tax=Cellulosimicrobium cellulans TaxID=1710 RepID=UPI0035D941B2